MRKSTWYGLTSVVCAVVGVGAIGAGGFLLAAFDSDDQIKSSASRIDGAGAAVIGDDLQVKIAPLPVPESLGSLTLDVTPVDRSDAIFVGAGPQAAVDSYLIAVPYDVLVDLRSGGEAALRPVPGNELPGDPSSSQPWAVQRSAAPGQPVRIALSDVESSTVMVTNLPPRNRVVVDVVATLTVPGVFRAALISFGVGLSLALVAGLLWWRHRVDRQDRRAHAAAPPANALSSITVLPSAGESVPAADITPLAEIPPASSVPEPITPGAITSELPVAVDVVPAPASAALAGLVAELGEDSELAPHDN